MGFPKGVSGNPGGRPKVGKTFAEALRLQLAREKDGLTTRDRIVAVVLNLALSGNLEAAKWVVERVDGRVPERLEVDATVRQSVGDDTIDAVLAGYAARGRARVSAP